MNLVKQSKKGNEKMNFLKKIENVICKNFFSLE